MTPLDQTFHIPVRANGLFVKPDDLYLMKNPFTGTWEIIADTNETIEKCREDGRLDAACQQIAELTRENGRQALS